MQVFKAGTLYFAVVFAAGFVLGTIRVLWLVPRLGERAAELAETPFMLGASVLAARWIVRRFTLLTATAKRLGAGLIALAFMLVAEFGFVLVLRNLTIPEYLSTRDPISSAVYLVSLGLFALMPLFVARTD